MLFTQFDRSTVMKKNSVFQDLKIIDLSTVLAGPSVGTFFAELGADVVKIEHPEFPDATRSWKLINESIDSPVSAYFSSINLGKKYLKLDFRNEKHHARLMELVNSADVVLMNFKKGGQEKLNITDTELRKTNEKLIIGKISGFGDESDRVAYDLILQAESGFMSMNGTPNSGPIKMPIALIDILAAHHLKEGLLIELLQKERFGADYEGSSISVSLYDAAICSLVNQASNYLMTGKIPKRIGSLHPNIAPYGELFTTKDGKTITFAIGSNKHFKKLCRYLNKEELINDCRFESTQSRVINRNKLQELIRPAIEAVEASKILDDLNHQFVPCGEVKNLEDVFKQSEAIDLVREEIIDNVKTQRVTSIGFKKANQ